MAGSAGIGFKHLKAYETATSVVIGPQAEDGGIYSSYELVGLTLKDIRPEMFTNVTGSYDRLGYIVPLSSLNWGWNMTLVVSRFDPAKTVITTPSNQPVPFSGIKLSQEGSDVVISLVEPYAKGDAKQIVLKNTAVNTLSATNFAGFSGSYSEATIDIPVFFDISVNVGVGGTLSPAPVNGVLKAKGGASFTVTLLPDTGYKVKSLTVDGVAQAVAGSYTFTAVNGAHSLSVSFEQGSSCPASWATGSVYTTGNKVTYNGNIYEAKWWNSGNVPSAGDPWKLIGACS